MKVSGTYRYITFMAILFIGIAKVPLWGQSSVSNEGQWHKLEIEKAGVYKIDYSFLTGMGIDPTK